MVLCQWRAPCIVGWSDRWFRNPAPAGCPAAFTPEEVCNLSGSWHVWKAWLGWQDAVYHYKYLKNNVIKWFEIIEAPAEAPCSDGLCAKLLLERANIAFEPDHPVAEDLRSFG